MVCDLHTCDFFCYYKSEYPPSEWTKTTYVGWSRGVRGLLPHNCLSAAAAARSTDKAQ